MYMYVLWGISFVKFSHETLILILSLFTFFFLSCVISLVTILHHNYHVTLQIICFGIVVLLSFVIVSCFV